MLMKNLLLLDEACHEDLDARRTRMLLLILTYTVLVFLKVLVVQRRIL